MDFGFEKSFEVFLDSFVRAKHFEEMDDITVASLGPYCRLVSMIAANHAKASMILVVMLDPSMTVRPVKLTLSLTGSHTFF